MELLVSDPVPDWVRSALEQFDQLSERELDVLALLPNGSSNRLIARNLGISESTVKFHLGSVARKLSLGTRVEIAVVAYTRAFALRPAVGSGPQQ